jgi:hypothetical protein
MTLALHRNNVLTIVQFEGGAPKKDFGVAADSSAYPRWMPDGRSILYTRGLIANVWSQPIGGGEPKQITHFDQSLVMNFDVFKDGKLLLLSRFSNSNRVILIHDLK